MIQNPSSVEVMQKAWNVLNSNRNVGQDRMFTLVSLNTDDRKGNQLLR